jgi:CheR methyltransferase, all-alpha domain
VEAFDRDLPPFLELIYDRFHYDFRDYSMESLKRRLRAGLAELGGAGRGHAPSGG